MRENEWRLALLISGSGTTMEAVIKAYQEKRLLGIRPVDLISQNGWMPLTPENVVKRYEGRAFNQHPGPLDPGRSKFDFGGKGMFGSRVTCARVAFEWVVGEKNPWTEATTHYVTEKYDEGDLLEHQNVIATLQAYAEGKQLGFRRTKPLIHQDQEQILFQAKKLAIKLFPGG